MHTSPQFSWQLCFHYAGDFFIALQQLERYPAFWIRFRNLAGDECENLFQHSLMISTDRRPGRYIDRRLAQHAFYDAHQLAQALIPGGYQGYHRQTERRFQDMGLNLDALLFGYIDHIEADHQRDGQADQLRHQVKIALQGGCINDDNDHIRLAFDDEIAGDAFLQGVGRQAIGAGQVNNLHRHAVLVVSASLELNRLTRPVANVLRKAGQQVENCGLANIWLAGQSNCGVYLQSLPRQLSQMRNCLLLIHPLFPQ